MSRKTNRLRGRLRIEQEQVTATDRRLRRWLTDQGNELLAVKEKLRFDESVRSWLRKVEQAPPHVSDPYALTIGFDPRRFLIALHRNNPGRFVGEREILNTARMLAADVEREIIRVMTEKLMQTRGA